MTWTKLSDDFSDDCWRLSDEAFRLHTEGLIWSNRKLLDCRVDKNDMRRWAKHPDAVGELLAVGWWIDQGDAYVIIHHAAYQRTRDQVLAQQATNQMNGRKGGRPKGPPRENRPRQSGGARKTQSLNEPESESLTERPTERDRTGQDRHIRQIEQNSDSRNSCECGRPAPDKCDGVCHWCAIKAAHMPS